MLFFESKHLATKNRVRQAGTTVAPARLAESAARGVMIQHGPAVMVFDRPGALELAGAIIDALGMPEPPDPRQGAKGKDDE